MKSLSAINALIDMFPPHRLDKFYPFVKVHPPSYNTFLRTDFWRKYYQNYVKDENLDLLSDEKNPDTVRDPDPIKIEPSIGDPDLNKVDPSAGPGNKRWLKKVKMSYFIEKELDISKDEIYTIGKYNYIKIKDKLFPFLTNSPIQGKIVTVIEEDTKKKYLAIAQQDKDAIILTRKIKGRYYPLIARKIDKIKNLKPSINSTILRK